MKRFLCFLLCMMLVIPTALSASDKTPVQKFRQQVITGGNGIRGTVELSVTGSSEWVDVLMPFTAAPLNIRAIGEKQGDESALVTDDDDWQIKLFAKDEDGNQRAVSYLYGGPEGMWFQSELLPDTLLSFPVQNVQLLYQLIDGEGLSLLTAFDPLSLMRGARSGNGEAYSAIAEMLQISSEEWTERWEHVLAKYYTELDMWLSLYAAEPVISGGTGSLTMTTSYTIPAEDLKEQTKSVIGMMLYDSELQNLLLPHVTMEQRVLYLNPSLVYFYEYCIDQLPLNGNLVLRREMTAKGETIGMYISLPLNGLPEEVTAPVGEAMAKLFSLPYTDIFSGIERITCEMSGSDVEITVSGPKRSISFIIDETASNAETVSWQGFVRITPAVGNNEAALSAAFAYRMSHRIWEDDQWVMHEDYTFSVSVEPDFSLSAVDDPFLSTYVDFMPVSLETSASFAMETDRTSRPVNLTLTLDAVLPDGQLGLNAELLTSTAWEHVDLPVNGGENVLTMNAARRAELLGVLKANAFSTMMALSSATGAEGMPAVTDAGNASTAEPSAEPSAEPTVVPPME